MFIKLPNLPYSLDALEPFISANTLSYHHTKHHQAYVTNLNALILGTQFEHMQLDEIIKQSSGPVFNNAAQIFNHTFYFESMRSSKNISDSFLKVIEKNFNTLDEFLTSFKKAAVSQFGSGWAWLCKQDGKLFIETTSNANLPKGTPLLTCDVWEHAYYLDYQNKRPDYVDVFLNNLIDWEIVEARYS